MFETIAVLAQAATNAAGDATPGYHPSLTTRMVPLAFALIVLLITVEMIRRRKLREEYALLWLGTSVALMVLAVFPKMVIWLQDTLGVNYLTIVALGSFLFLSMIMVHFAIVISRQAEEIRQLAQKLALMNQKMEESSKVEDRNSK